MSTGEAIVAVVAMLLVFRAWNGPSAKQGVVARPEMPTRRPTMPSPPPPPPPHRPLPRSGDTTKGGTDG